MLIAKMCCLGGVITIRGWLNVIFDAYGERTVECFMGQRLFLQKGVSFFSQLY